MGNQRENGSPSAVPDGNPGGGAEKELEQKKHKHRERARAYYLRNKEHVIEKARARYRRKQESQKKAEGQNYAEGQEKEGDGKAYSGIQKGTGKAEVLKRSEMPPLLQALDYVNEHLDGWLAAWQKKGEPARSAAQDAGDSGSQSASWGLPVALPAPSKQSEYERYLREREWRPSSPPPPPRPGYKNYDIGYGRIMQVRDPQEPPAPTKPQED